MWPFAKKKCIDESGLLIGFTECHCHLLPGVDDGVKTFEEAFELLSVYEDAGIEHVWLTPHIMEDVPNATADLRRRFVEFCAEYDGPIGLSLASENMLDNIFEERLAANDFLPIGARGDHLLVETSFFTPPTDLDGKLRRVTEAGYFPLLAHPERYMYMDLDDIEEHYESGVRLQLNLYSLLGMYGPEAEHKARKLLRKGMYSAVGTDTHRMRQLQFGLKEKRLDKQDLAQLRQLIESSPLL